MSLPPFIDRASVHARLQTVFSEGLPQRNYCVRQMAASAVFVMLYVGAVEGMERWVAPKHVIRMTARQAGRKEEAERLAYGSDAMKPGFRAPGKRWYEDNSREPLRDETIRQGLIVYNAVIERSGLATTSGLPRYALRAEFAALFDPSLDADSFARAADDWRRSHIGSDALARTALVRRGAATSREGMLVTFPNGETRRMAAGPSSVISKAVIEEFAPRFLREPAVLWVSESGAKVVARDDQLAATLNLRIDADRHLPDIILADLGAGADFLLVFIEVVATDGSITPQRRDALAGIATDAGFPLRQLAFVTAYLDRAQAAFKKTIPELAWGSFAWFASEPGHIVALYEGSATPLLLSTLRSV